jgi:hypothetical protein
MQFEVDVPDLLFYMHAGRTDQAAAVADAVQSHQQGSMQQQCMCIYKVATVQGCAPK